MMKSVLAAIASLALMASAASVYAKAAPCRDTKGKFVKSPKNPRRLSVAATSRGGLQNAVRQAQRLPSNSDAGCDAPGIASLS
jgi:uncharacterized protein YxeA